MRKKAKVPKARLNAIAPEMYRVLRQFVAEIDGCAYGDTDGDLWKITNRAIRIIAKATGEKPHKPWYVRQEEGGSAFKGYFVA